MSAVPIRRDQYDDAVETSNVIAFAPAGCPTSAMRRNELGTADRDRLDRLRWLALRSRLRPKPDIERACYVLAGNVSREIEPVANAFFRGLDVEATRPIDLHRPGTRNPSNDEIWLLRLLAAFESGRDIEGGALVTWRIRPQGRRWMRFLATSLADLLGGGTPRI